MITRFSEWIVLRHKFLALISVVVVVAAAIGMGRLTFDADYRIFFGEDNPQLTAFDVQQNTYTKNDLVLLVLEPSDGQVFTPKTLDAVEWLTEQSWQMPYSSRVDSISNFQHTYSQDDDMVVEDLITGAIDMSPADIEKIRDVALSEPLIARRLVSEKAHVTAVNITMQMPGIDQTKEVPEVMAKIREMVVGFEQRYPHITVHTTGIVPFNNAFSEASINDMSLLMPLMFAIIIFILGFMLRSVTAAFAAVVIILASVVTTMGLAGWLGVVMNTMTTGVPTIVMTLAVADCVHLLSNYFHAQSEGMDKRKAMVESLRINMLPIFLTSVTTAIGFMTMNFSEVPPLHDLGNMVAIGVMLAFILSVVFLPGVMLMLPSKVKPLKEDEAAGMDRLASLVITHKRKFFWGVLAVVIVTIAQLPRNELNDEFVKYFDESMDFRQATEFTVDNLTGIYNFNYSVPAGESNGISNPEFLAHVDAFVEWFRARPEVIHVSSITDIFKRLNKNLNGDDPDWYKLPEAQDQAAQYLLLYEMSLPYGLDLNDQLNVDKSATRLSVTIKSISTNEVLALEKAAEDWMAANWPETIHATASSPTIMFAHIGYRNIRSSLTGAFVALVLISAILMIALRSLKIGILSIIPNVIPVAMGFGFWAVWNGRVGMALAIVASMTIGIVVDDTVHFLSKYLRARREKGLSPEGAVRYAFHQVGTALWVTTVVLVVGFIVLGQSQFGPTSEMGVLTAATIALALAIDFLFLPPLLLKLEEKPNA